MDSGDADAPPAMLFRVLRGVLLEVRPLPTAAAFFLVLLGTLWAGRSLWPPPPYLPWAMLAALFGMLTAHFSDSYTDVVKRGDRTPVDFPLLFRDSTGVLRDVEYRALLGCCVTASAAATVPVAVAGGPLPALLLLAALALAVGYARWLDRAFVGVTFGYPAGACTLFAASYLASGGPADARAALMASALFCALVGIKVRADVIDIDGDRAIGKRRLDAERRQRRHRHARRLGRRQTRYRLERRLARRGRRAPGGIYRKLVRRIGPRA